MRFLRTDSRPVGPGRHPARRTGLGSVWLREGGRPEPMCTAAMGMSDVLMMWPLLEMVHARGVASVVFMPCLLLSFCVAVLDPVAGVLSATKVRS